VATGTHGSGDRNGSLSAAVRALELVGADGELRRVERGEPDFAGSVVALGCLGIVTRVTLDAEPAFELRQDVFTDIPWQDLQTDFDNLTGNAYSVSVFTDWLGDRVRQVWVKSRADQPPAERLLGRPPAGETLHMLRGGALEAVTEQGGVPGPWHERLPHFRTAFTPSRGEELQSEYLLPRACLADAVDGLRTLGDRLTGVLQGSEIRTVAADELWLSGAYGADVAGVHFTWVRDPAGVYAVLPLVEEVLLPMGGRPHWGKCFVAAGGTVTGLYPRMADFAGLRDRMDPGRKFLNDYVSRVLGLSG
jgi:xylitol oxidase